MDEGLKKYDCLVTLSCCWKQNSYPKQVQGFLINLIKNIYLKKNKNK